MFNDGWIFLKKIDINLYSVLVNVNEMNVMNIQVLTSWI